ncbi:MAG TPA: hypothetical protein VIL65_04265 [Beijerinckiaceae bacterium]|jgi:hypothetical protein
MINTVTPDQKRYCLPWYRAEDWSSLHAMGVSDLPNAYADWRISAEQIEGELTRVGVRVERVVVEPGALAAWCRRHGLVPSGTARQQFANEGSSPP